jgi:hypothetical protein
MAEWRDNMTLALAQGVTGFFNPACYIHTAFSTTSPTIGGKSYMDVFAAWYAGAGGSAVQVADSCGVTCNPTCPH